MDQLQLESPEPAIYIQYMLLHIQSAALGCETDTDKVCVDLHWEDNEDVILIVLSDVGPDLIGVLMTVGKVMKMAAWSEAVTGQ